MSYEIKRIDPFWKANPIFFAMAVGGTVLGVIGTNMNHTMIVGAGFVVAAIGVLLATKPLVSTVLGTLGFLGGLATFVILPNANSMGMTPIARVLSVLLFSAIYMVLMDAIVLLVACIYNTVSGLLGLGGITLEFEEGSEAS